MITIVGGRSQTVQGDELIRQILRPVALIKDERVAVYENRAITSVEHDQMLGIDDETNDRAKEMLLHEIPHLFRASHHGRTDDLAEIAQTPLVQNIRQGRKRRTGGKQKGNLRPQEGREENGSDFVPALPLLAGTAVQDRAIDIPASGKRDLAGHMRVLVVDAEPRVLIAHDATAAKTQPFNFHSPPLL